MPELDTLRPRVRVGLAARSRTRAGLSRAILLWLLLFRRWRSAGRRVTLGLSPEELRIHSALVGLATLLAVGALIVTGWVAALIVWIFCLGGLWLFPLPALRELEHMREGAGYEAPVSWRDRLARQRALRRRPRSRRRSSVRLRHH